MAFATAVAAEAAVAAAQAAAEVVRLTSMPHYTGKTMEEIAAVKIQTVFRGYMVFTYFSFYLLGLYKFGKRMSFLFMAKGRMESVEMEGYKEVLFV